MIAAAVRGGEEDKAVKAAKRRLLLRDSITFSILALIAGALFGVTFFLFKSFESHRDDLGQRWAERGQQALTAHQPAVAIVALRAALTYAPDDVDYQMLLAQALADSGHTDEAISYYLNRWDSAPGDGFVNLQLARLARQKNDSQQAVEYYRAAIFGDWGANGADKRRQVRMELSDFLIERRDLAAARAELLIGASNAPDGTRSDLLYADRLQAANDPGDAMKYYEKAIADDPHNSEALEQAGRVAYALGQYRRARSLLDRALRYLKPNGRQTAGSSPAPAATRADSMTLLARNADRMQELNLSRELPARERADHLEVASAVARQRLHACVVQARAQSRTQAPSGRAIPQGPTIEPVGIASQQAGPASPAAPVPPDLQALAARWRVAASHATQRALTSNAAIEDSLTQLIFDTELITAGACGAPGGDDALLLQMASDPRNSNAARPN